MRVILDIDGNYDSMLTFTCVGVNKRNGNNATVNAMDLGEYNHAVIDSTGELTVYNTKICNTRADKIRNMSDEELAKFMEKHDTNTCKDGYLTYDEILKYPKEEV